VNSETTLSLTKMVRCLLLQNMISMQFNFQGNHKP